MPAIRARDVCERALRLLGVVSAEEPIAAYQAQTALEAFNALLDSWSTERLLMPVRPRLTLPLVPYKQVYTWGVVEGEPTPADVSSPAPVRLDICLLTVPGSPEQEWPLAILTQEDYEQQIWQKAFTGIYPECVYLHPTRPYAQLQVWPVPTLAYSLGLLPWPSLPLYPHWDSSQDWPEGYLRTFAYGLACEVAPEYGVEPSPTVQRIADESKRSLFPINARRSRLQMVPGSGPYQSHLVRFYNGG